jgi:hypothetical protein
VAREGDVRNADDTATYPLVIAIRGVMDQHRLRQLKHFLETAVAAQASRNHLHQSDSLQGIFLAGSQHRVTSHFGSAQLNVSSF